MSAELEDLTGLLSTSLQAQVQMKRKLKQLQKKTLAKGFEDQNLLVVHEMQVSHLKTKIKLLEEALTNRNHDIDEVENNNQQLLDLLEKYDKRLEQMQNCTELKEVEIMELKENLVNKNDSQRQMVSDESSISTKLTFLEAMTAKLR